MCNNPDKAALLWNSSGKHKEIEMEVGGETLKSTESEKLLGVVINSNLDWSTHVDNLCSTLKKRISLLRRIKERVNSEKLDMISDAIFTSKLRYGIAVYSNPKFEFNNMEQAMDPNIVKLQVIQNDLLRMQMGHTLKNHTNMQKLRESKKIMSVNQISCYHVAIEMFNVINNSSSKSIQENLKMVERGYSLRSLEDGQVKVPIKGKKSCQGFSYIGPKLWNYLPKEIRTTTKIDPFKSKLKEWIWSHIPSI